MAFEACSNDFFVGATGQQEETGKEEQGNERSVQGN